MAGTVLSTLRGPGRSGCLYLDQGINLVLPAVPLGILALEVGSGWQAFPRKVIGMPGH